MVVPLVFILFTALIFNMYIKLTRIIGNVINFFIHIFIIFSVLFLEFIIFSRFFFSLAIILLWCVSVNILRFLFFTNCNDYNLPTGSAFFCVHSDIDKNGDCLESNNNDFLNDLWLLFETLFFFLNV